MILDIWKIFNNVTKNYQWSDWFYLCISFMIISLACYGCAAMFGIVDGITVKESS